MMHLQKGEHMHPSGDSVPRWVKILINGGLKPKIVFD